uniref:Ectonucleotide pyrophosphatase/phosphodiesterase family member 3 n=1 Tax=Neogobius melanostomus TaxID=47308 RepID=A0A8C6TQ64_9GOBI
NCETRSEQTVIKTSDKPDKRDFSSCFCSFSKQPLLLVSLDGWRADYLQTWSKLVPVVDKLQKCGTSTRFMQAAFPSKTFPNHWTIATGLYPESNGLIDNNMYDPDMDASFSLSSPEKDNPAWYHGQPIWHTAAYQGLKSATFFWPGSDVKVNGSFPDIYRPYDGSGNLRSHSPRHFSYLLVYLKNYKNLITCHMHLKCLLSLSQLIEALQGVDLILGQLMNGLQQLRLHRCVNIIIVADHGNHGDQSCERKEALQDFVGDVQKYLVREGPLIYLNVKLFPRVQCRTPGQKTRPYLKQNLPKRLHFANSRRIEDVNVLVTPQWLFERFCSGGTHGWDNDVESMHAMFLSYGPKFRPRTEVEPFSNIELYNLMCDLLEIVPTENNGTHGSMNHLQRAPYHTPTAPPPQSPAQECPLTALDPAHTLNCSCPLLSNNSINERLNLSSAQVEASDSTHLPFGPPVLLQASHSVCSLRHQGFISGYSWDRLQPLWTSYTVPKPDTEDSLGPVVSDCLRPDVRVPPAQSPTCEAYSSAAPNISPGFLYPPNLNVSAEQQFDALTTSNISPMFPQFQRIWRHFHAALLPRYAALYNGLNVLSGPVFDYNYDGRYDSPQQIQMFVPGSKIPVPTHYFIVLTSCRNSSRAVLQCDGPLQTVSFVLPHREDNSESCESAASEEQWVEQLMWFHQSRVRDVELLAGLDLYQGSSRPITELLQMKTRPTADIRRKA